MPSFNESDPVHQRKFHNLKFPQLEQFQPQHVWGTGSITGDMYQAVGIFSNQFTIYGDTYPATFININIFDIIGQGKGNNFTIHETLHTTVNTNGDTTVSFDNFKAACQ